MGVFFVFVSNSIVLIPIFTWVWKIDNLSFACEFKTFILPKTFLLLCESFALFAENLIYYFLNIEFICTIDKSIVFCVTYGIELR